nr:hypothetical protein [Ktedonobacterales bacterium]
VHNPEAIDAEIYGLLKLRSVIHGHHQKPGIDLLHEALDFLEAMADVDERKGRDYEEEVREKARSLGRGVPLLSSVLTPSRMQKRRDR